MREAKNEQPEFFPLKRKFKNNIYFDAGIELKQFGYKVMQPKGNVTVRILLLYWHISTPRLYL